jgi:hypothetical protein
MKIIKKIVKIGGSLGVVFDKVIVDSFKMKAGDLVDISDIIVLKVKEKKK